MGTSSAACTYSQPAGADTDISGEDDGIDASGGFVIAEPAESQVQVWQGANLRHVALLKMVSVRLTCRFRFLDANHP